MGESPTMAHVTLDPCVLPWNSIRCPLISDLMPSAFSRDCARDEFLRGLNTQSNAPNVIDSIRYLVPFSAVIEAVYARGIGVEEHDVGFLYVLRSGKDLDKTVAYDIFYLCHEAWVLG